MIEPGDKAPDFTLPDQRGDPVSLAELRGQEVVLYFYPKADTPGNKSSSSGSGAYVRPLDDGRAVLQFPLLADEDHAVAEAYGVWVEKSMYGRKYMGVERTTFVISPEGVIRNVFRRVKPGEHDAVVLEALAGG